jgi:hypothetical protein
MHKLTPREWQFVLLGALGATPDDLRRQFGTRRLVIAHALIRAYTKLLLSFHA